MNHLTEVKINQIYISDNVSNQLNKIANKGELNHQGQSTTSNMKTLSLSPDKLNSQLMAGQQHPFQLDNIVI